MTTGLTVGTLMDRMDTIAEHDPDAPVTTDTGDVIFTLAPETPATGLPGPPATTHARVAAMTLDATSNGPVSVDDVRAMFAYYNVATPRSNNANGACRHSTILILPMHDHPRHIATVTHTVTDGHGHVVLVTAPND